MQTRTYERIGTENTESVVVHITDDGYVRITADNLHQILDHLGFIEIQDKRKAA